MSDLESIGEAARAFFEQKNEARERALAASREIVRSSANTIRALHRNDLAAAETLLQQTAASVSEVSRYQTDQPDIYYTGFVQDALKEYAEASTFKALLLGQDLPTPEDLDIGYVPYLNGLGEAVGELRRHLLDCLRRGDVERAESILPAMDDICNILATIDYPEAMTGGLRRTTDAQRATVERSRGDLTVAARQRDLELALRQVEQKLGR
ncbi:MAG: haloacid dehalogenase [Bacteroidetes bacterium]|nr:haloacid dehalogenase [Bacteroidota bacterium]MCL5026047.1 haloacid dehalogenase [Chloroflexota bacterium]